MAVLYIKEQGACVQKVGERIVVTKNKQSLLDVPVFQIENMTVIGNVQITTQALHFLMQKGVDVSYMTFSGQYLGHTAADSSKNIFLRFEQYQAYLNQDRRLELGKTITRNKIDNQLALIESHRGQMDDYNPTEIMTKITRMKQTISDKKSCNELMGVEGICSRMYFEAYGHMFRGDFEFHGRNRRPPRDPINVIISLAYTLLTKEVCNALDAASFEPYLGFMHGIRYGRKSLGLDIVEEFRQPAVDRMVLLIFNKRILGKYDFDMQGQDRVILTEEGFRKFCRFYEQWMNGKNAASGENSFRTRIQEQVDSLKKAIMEHTAYAPYAWRQEHVSGEL